MEQYNELLVDACIPIAKFKGSDPAFQLQHTDIFFQMVESYPLKILIIKKVLSEANKYNYLMDSINDFFTKLESKGKFFMIQNDRILPQARCLSIWSHFQ